MRRLPFELRSKLDKKLDEFGAKDIIEEVSRSPTLGVSPLVVVPKADEDIRICVDMRRANAAIEEVLYALNKSTVFSQLDLKWGFHQVELDEKSREITIFVTHGGLYRYKRLMFGITTAHEKYQKIVAVLQGCRGVANLADDLIVHDCGIGEHYRNMHLVLTQLREKGLTLKGDKCQFRLPKLTFSGHDLSSRGITPSEECQSSPKCFAGHVFYSTPAVFS